MFQRRPAHVGDAFAAVFGKTFHPSGQESQAWIAAFIALFKQQLQAKADAEQRTIFLAPAQQVGHQSGGPEVGHGWIEGADPGQDQRINAFKIIGRFDRGADLPQPLQAFLHGVEIAHAVID